MPPRDVVLTDQDAELIERLVRSGRYRSASEVLGEGLRLLEARIEAERARLAALRAAARVGLEDLESGRYVSLDSPVAIDRFIESVAEAERQRRRRARRRDT